MKKAHKFVLWLCVISKTVNTYSLFVGFFVEFVEQEEEHDSVHANPPDKCTWVVAIDEQQLESMKHDQDELNLFKCRNSKSYQLIFVSSTLFSLSRGNVPFVMMSNTSSTTNISGIVDPWQQIDNNYT